MKEEDKLRFLEWGSIEICKIGIPAEPLDFLKRAIHAGHPTKGIEMHVDEVIHKVVVENLHDCPYSLAKKRIEFFKRWQERAKVIDSQGDAFIRQAPEHAQRILHGKRLQLWGEILQDLGYVDNNLITDIANGFDLTGWLRKSGVFAVGVRAPSFGRDTWLKLGKGLNQATLKAMERHHEQHLPSRSMSFSRDGYGKLQANHWRAKSLPDVLVCKRVPS